MIIMDFIEEHPWIASIIGAIIVLFAVAALIGLMYFLLRLYSISKIASAIIILFPAMVIFIRVMISS